MSSERVTAAAETMEDAAMRWTGRDLGTIHRDGIAEEALTAADASDREHGIVRVDPDDPATIERGVAAVLFSMMGPMAKLASDSARNRAEQTVRTVLAAVTQEAKP